MSIAFLLIIALVSAALAIGLLLFLRGRRQGHNGPACGACGYNLTGSTANQCPECGRLFIEAGVLVGQPRSPSRLILGICLSVSLALAFFVGITVYQANRAVAARRRANAARLRAVAAQAQGVQAPNAAPTPTTNAAGDSADRP